MIGFVAFVALILAAVATLLWVAFQLIHNARKDTHL